MVRERPARPAGTEVAPPPAGAGLPPRRTRTRTFLLPPWTRAPLLAFGERAVILAVLAATVILACASSSAALFLSSAASESLRRILAADCPDAGFPAVQVGPVTSVPADRLLEVNGPFAQPVENIPDLAALSQRARSALTAAGFTAPYHAAVADEPARALPAGPRINLFQRDGATANIQPIAGGSGRGVWIPAALATRLDLRPGQQLALAGPNSPPTSLRVVGVYRDLWQRPTTPYWCSYESLFQNQASVDPPPPELVIATDEAAFAAAQLATGVRATHTWSAPVDTEGMTLSRAKEITAGQADAYRRLGVPPPLDLGAQNSGTGQMPVFAQNTELIRDGLRGPVVPIALGGTILALLLVGAAGSYWADRRSREVRLLSARGVSPAALAGKAVLELVVPAAVGTLLGWQLARWLVRSLGPNPHVDPAAPGQALLTATAALAAGLALLAFVAGLRSRRATERPVGARRTWLAVVPWELALLLAAAGCYLRLRGGEAVVLERNVAQVSLLVVAFPLLFLVGATVLVVRLLALGLPAVGRLAGRRSPAWYLAARRVTASRAMSVTLIAAAAMPIAMLVYAAGLTQTSQYTLDAKAQLLVGSNVSVTTTAPLRRTPETDRVGTLVTRYLYGTTGPAADVAVLAIDPDTFAHTAFWDHRFADQPLPELLDLLRQPVVDGRVPALVVGALPPTFEAQLGTTTARFYTVGTAKLFPGRQAQAPMVVVSAARLGPVDPHAGSRNELWTLGTEAAARAALDAQQARVFDVRDRQRVFDAANLLGISWTFGYLTALAGLVGLVAIGGLLLYLETRQRARVASYALGRRMGLTRRTHLRSMLAELGTLLLTAYAVGAALAWVSILLVYRRLDVDLSRPPPPLFTPPTVALLGSAAAVLVVTTLAALYAQRAADRTDVSTVLRLGG